jgi:hypothetical protein
MFFYKSQHPIHMVVFPKIWKHRGPYYRCYTRWFVWNFHILDNALMWTIIRALTDKHNSNND